MTIVNDLKPRNQYSASSGQTVFTYSFAITEETDIKVYQRAESALIDETLQLLTLNVDYTVQDVGVSTGGTITLTTSATLNDIITLLRIEPIERLSNYTAGTDIKSSSLNSDINNFLFLAQQLELLRDKLTPHYFNSAVIVDADIELPVLDTASIWYKDSLGKIVSLPIDNTIDVDVLIANLAKQTEGTDGALMIGYYDALSSTGKTLKAKLDELQTQITNYINLLSSKTSGADGASEVGYWDTSTGTGKTVKTKLDELVSTSGADSQLRAMASAAITSSGQTYNIADNTQLKKTYANYAGAGASYTASGTANAILLTNKASYQAPILEDGLVVTFKATNTNTGASTINVASLGVKSIVTEAGVAIAANTIVAGDIIELFYDGTNFIVRSVVTDASETVKGIIEIATQAEALAGTDDTKALTPLKMGVRGAQYSSMLNGGIIQYGAVVANVTVGGFPLKRKGTVTLPTAFANTNYKVVIYPGTVTGNAISIIDRTTTTFTIIGDSNGADFSVNYHVMGD